jgi:MarR family transcriptional regulator, transcriptional regulator for hemolysin
MLTLLRLTTTNAAPGEWTIKMNRKSDSDLLVVLYDVARHMRTYSDQMAREHGMTRAQWIILARLERQPELSQNELAALAEASPMTIARLVDRLEEQGLVERCTDLADRRIWRLRLTPAAVPVLRQIKHYRAEIYELMTRGIDADVLDALASGLGQMKDNISRRRATNPAA